MAIDRTDDEYNRSIGKGNILPFEPVRGQQRADDLTGRELHPAVLRDPKAIPPRRWLYGTILLRGFVSVLVAPGATGKSLYAMLVAASIATKRSFLGDHLFSQCNVCYINLEDPYEELERRLAAIRLHHSISDDELSKRYFMHSGDNFRVTIAKLQQDDTGLNIVHPDEDFIYGEIERLKIGLLVIDPFAESHELEESSNPHMVAAMAAWRRVARDADCAVLLVHHIRKSNGTKADIDSARGAKAITDSARVGLIMSGMSAAEADLMGIKPEEQRAYVRVDDAKMNLAPAAADARWFHIVGVPLGNATEEYPNGDNVATIEAWQKPGLFSKDTSKDLNRVLDIIDAGLDGVRYLPTRRANTTMWAGDVLVRELKRTPGEAAAMLQEWLKSGLIIIQEYHNKRTSKSANGVYVDATKRPD